MSLPKPRLNLSRAGRRPELPPRSTKFADLPLLHLPDETEEPETPCYVGTGSDPEAELPPEPPVGTPTEPDRAVSVPTVEVLGAEGVVGPATEPEIRRESSAPAVVAEQFLALVKSGVAREEAAERVVGMPYPALKSRADVVRAVQRLMDDFTVDEEMRTRMRKAGVNRIFLENVTQGDPFAQKLALEAAKQIAADSGVTDKKTLVGVNVNFTDLERFLKPPDQEHD